MKVLKYGTGHDVPEGATYLCTQVEHTDVTGETPDGYKYVQRQNTLVWHYFLVEGDNDEQSA